MGGQRSKTLILRSANQLKPVAQRSFSEFVPHWAERRGDTPALCERDARGEWRRITWASMWQQVQSVAAALLEMGLGPQRPLMMLSGNSIEQAVLLLATEYAGIPVAHPVAGASGNQKRNDEDEPAHPAAAVSPA